MNKIIPITREAGERLIEETNELRKKVNNLNKFMSTNAFYKLDRAVKDVIYDQSEYMLKYLRALGLRLELHGLKLTDLDVE